MSVRSFKLDAIVWLNENAENICKQLLFHFDPSC